MSNDRPAWAINFHPKHDHRPRRYRRFLSGARRALDARERIFGRRYRRPAGKP
jgi:hypothetical protein